MNQHEKRRAPFGSSIEKAPHTRMEADEVREKSRMIEGARWLRGAVRMEIRHAPANLALCYIATDGRVMYLSPRPRGDAS